MSGIFGILTRDGSPVPPELVAALRDGMVTHAPGQGDVWSDGPAALGPLPSFDQAGGFAFTMAGRLDHRHTLVTRLHAERELPSDTDPDDEGLLRAAYRRRGAGAAALTHGDWAFAAWHPAQRRLVLARDKFGITALYYHAGPRLFAFASSRRALLALAAKTEIDELFLAQLLVAWPAYEGERTAHAAIRRLPPAHLLTLTPDRLEVQRYWSMDEVSPLHLTDRRDYARGFLDVFDVAVADRLRCAGEISATLSGGLDSGAVTATAAAILQRGGRRLHAFTSVPRFDSKPYASDDRGDEFLLASLSARSAQNVEQVAVRAEDVTPIQAIRLGLAITNEPGHAAASLYWILAILDAARSRECEVLLTGQLGNGGISWAGDPLSQPLAYQLRTPHARGVAKARLARRLPAPLLRAARRRRIDPEWFRSSAIHPAVVRRLDLTERRLDDPDDAPGLPPLRQRLSILRPGRSIGGSIWAEFGMAYGVDVRDPTGDDRVLSFVLSVPDHVFIDPETGVDRWLIREAMRDRLPDEVRLNRRRGVQTADLVPRLRASAVEVDGALDELASGAAATYVDVAYMRETWRMVQAQDTPEALRKAVSVIGRGIMAGLFVNEWAK